MSALRCAPAQRARTRPFAQPLCRARRLNLLNITVTQLAKSINSVLTMAYRDIYAESAEDDVGQLHRSIVRDAVLLYGKGVGVEEVHRYIHGQCAFRASAADQLSAIWVELSAEPFRLPGAVGGVPSRVRAVTALLALLSSPFPFTDRTRYSYSVKEESPVSR